MRDETISIIASLILGSLLGGCVGGVFVESTARRFQREAIEHGCAEYSSTTGEWGWKKGG